MKLYYAPYCLTFRRSFRGDGLASGHKTGALLSVGNEEGFQGWADCFALPERGEAPWQEQLQQLARGQWTPLTEAAFAWAQLEVQAKKDQRSLFQGCPPLQSHRLWDRLEEASLARFELEKHRPQCWKIKVGGPHWAEQCRCLASLFQTLGCRGHRFRLDANGLLTSAQFSRFCQDFEPFLPLLDCVEDPFPYDPEEWTMVAQRWPVRLALDELPEGPATLLKPGSFHILVLKPASSLAWKDQVKAWKNEVSFLVTTSLGHPIGQLEAAWAYWQLTQDPSVQLERPGLLSHQVYDPTLCSQALRVEEDWLFPPTGIGWGLPLLGQQRLSLTV